MSQSTKNYIKIAMAAMLWGTLGFFGTILKKYQLSPEMIAFSRLFSGVAILVIFFGIKNPSVLKIDSKGLLKCAVVGIISQGIFNLAFFTAMRTVGAFTTTVLLYTSIFFLFLMGTILYKEKPTAKKFISAFICLIGCVFGATGGDFSTLNANFFGVMMGVLAGFTYSLMPVLNKSLSFGYNPFTIIIYSFLSGLLFLTPFAKPWVWIASNQNHEVYGIMILFGIIASCLPYALYIPSLDHIQISKVGVITSVELIVSILISGYILKERIVLGHALGVVLIICSIILMNTSWKTPRKRAIPRP